MIVLTGGAGFIGSCFLQKLNQEGIEDILVVDQLENDEKWKNLVGKKFRDYVQKDDLLGLVEKNKLPRPKSIVHIGACSSTTLIDADYFIKNNFEYSKTLAKWAFLSKAHFMYASSAATYGAGDEGYSDENETTYTLRPLNMYGYSKQLFDLWVLSNGYEKMVTGFKFFNVFGPNEYHKGDMMSVICKNFKDVREKGKIRLFKSYRKEYSDGGQKRDFVYVKDVVDVMYDFFRDPSRKGIYNLGTGEARSWNDLAQAMFAALGKKPNIEYIEMPESLKPKYQYYTQADMSKLRRAGCSHKFMPLEKAIKDYTTYLLEQKYL